MIQIEVKVRDTVSKELGEIVSTLSGQGMADLNAAGGRSAAKEAEDWHTQFNDAGGWRGKRYMQGSEGRPGEWGAEVASAWHFRTADGNGAVIANGAPHYAFKVRGGTIRPKRVSWLTIPLIPEAKGRKADTYAIDFNTRLFRPKGKNALMEKTEGGGIRSVYALVKSVTLSPFPKGIPDTEVLADAFATGWRGALAEKSELFE